MPRTYNYNIMPEIMTRYALKHFVQEDISREEVMPVVEAARYGPSCFNEQPERYIIGDNGDHPEDHKKLADCLGKGNAYAKKAPVLMLVMTKKTFTYNGKNNAWSRFDAGTATGFLQLEAVRRGYGVHCMAGFDADQAREAFGIDEDLDIIAMIAMGHPAPLNTLTPEERAEENPGTRNPIESFVLNR